MPEFLEKIIVSRGGRAVSLPQTMFDRSMSGNTQNYYFDIKKNDHLQHKFKISTILSNVVDRTG